MAFCCPHSSRTRSQARVKTLPTNFYILIARFTYFVDFLFILLFMQIGTGVTSSQSGSQFIGPNEQECHAARNNARYTELLAGKVFKTNICL